MVTTLETVRSVIANALSKGALQKSQMRTVWDVAGKCENPQHVALFARPSAKTAIASPDDRTIVVAPGRPQPLEIEIGTRCRQCLPCRRYRAFKWAMRAVEETKASQRTWFGTLTLKPERQFHYLSVARARVAEQSADLDADPAETEFTERCKAIGAEITRFFKRVRKNSAAQLRYLIVAEAHKSGAPHFHMLLHESAEIPVRHNVLKAAWRDGFSDFKLVDNQNTSAVWYVCKYLSKSSMARVRASLEYGRPPDIGPVARDPIRPPLLMSHSKQVQS